MTNPTPRDQRTELFEIEEQDDRSPFVLIDANGQRVEAETPREQRLFLYGVFEQDNPSPYAMVDREEWFACQATKQKERRLAREWSDYAAEPVVVEQVGSIIYGFGSELACLRIFAHYQSNGAFHNPRSRVGYSEPRASWYFSLDVQF